MKHLSLLFLAIVILSSCSQSTEEKANSLIKDEMNKTLVKIKTYEPVETKIDSAYSPLDAPEFLKTLKEIVNESQEAEGLSREVELAKTSMAIYGGPYPSELSRNEYRKHKEEYERYSAKLDELKNRLKKKGESLVPLFKKEPSFIGYRVVHKFRYENEEGQTTFGNMLFIIDKDLKSILASYDMDSMEYQLMEQSIKEIQEVAEATAAETEQNQAEQ